MDPRAAAGFPLRLAADVGSRAALAALDAVLGSRIAAEAVDRVVASALVERAVEALLATDALEHVLASAENAGVPRRVIASGLIDDVVERLLDSQEMWILVDEIARSHEVTDAIGRQGVGFADQIAGIVRERSRSADDRLDHLARRVRLRRHAPTPTDPQVS